MLDKLIKWTPKKIKNWEKTRSKGKKRFVWLNGVVFFGIWMFLLMTVFNHLQVSGFDIHNIKISFSIVIINLVVWPIAGYIWGLWTWSITEKSYKVYSKKT